MAYLDVLGSLPHRLPHLHGSDVGHGEMAGESHRVNALMFEIDSFDYPQD